MPKFFVETNQIKDKKIKIEGKDINHIKNVLRLKSNDKIEICNSQTYENYNCKIETISNESIICSIIDKIKKDTEATIKTTIFQGIPKFDKMELIIQKSVELGVYDITPVSMKRCVVKINEKDQTKKIQRWNKISEVAAKQSGRNIIPKVNNIIEIKNIAEIIKNYDIFLIAYEEEKENYIKQEIKKIKKQENLKIGILIGPEGGLEKQDVENLKRNGAKIISLGSRILRTETVALNILSILNYELEI